MTWSVEAERPKRRRREMRTSSVSAIGDTVAALIVNPVTGRLSCSRAALAFDKSADPRYSRDANRLTETGPALGKLGAGSLLCGDLRLFG